jgi:putative tryptophan/tyrosine transport system substrate-binding protein
MHFDRLKRREVMMLLGGAVVWPFAARAQQAAMPVVGFLNGASPEGYAPFVAAFREGLRQTGFVEGENVSIEYRWANGQYDRLRSLADDLVRRRVSVIAATSTPANLVAKAATDTIPIVFTTGSDPVQLGLVPSVSHPGGNVTGAVQLNTQLALKRLELAHELVPTASQIALLVNPTDPTSEPQSRSLAAAAKSIGLTLHMLRASSDPELEDAFAAVARLHAGALLFAGDVYFNSRAARLGALSLRYGVPAIFELREFAASGGLASYSGSLAEGYRAAGVYVGRILKGEKPGDLPVQQITRVELLINLKTAKALGITVPLPLLSRADEVIE